MLLYRLAIHHVGEKYTGLAFLPEMPNDALTEDAAMDAGGKWADDHPKDIVMLIPFTPSFI